MKMKWDQDTQRFYEGGVDQGALFPLGSSGYEKGVAWNGLTKVEEKPTGAEITKKYANNKQYAQLQSAEEYEATIEAYTFPDEFYPCNGMKQVADGVFAHQQNRKRFGLVFRSLIGNDVDGYDYGFKYHVVYGCLAKPASQSHDTTDDDVDIDPLSWDISATAPSATIAGIKPAATYTIDSRLTSAEKIAQFENLVYGSESSEPTMPTPEQIIEIFGTVDDTNDYNSADSGSETEPETNPEG